MPRLARCLTLRSILLAIVLAVAAPGAGAQKKRARLPDRPALDRGADPNDWRAYLQCGVLAEHGKRAQACYIWAHLLDPSRPEPLFGEFLITALADSTAMRRAYLLDPFVHHGRVLGFESGRAMNRFTPPITRAWGALQQGDWFGATKSFGEHLAGSPRDPEARWGIALALYYRQRYDSSAMHLGALLGTLVSREDPHENDPYRSRTFVSYMQGTAWLAAGRRDSARTSLERSLAATPDFYHARMLLADVALAEGDTTAAEAQWTTVLGQMGDDAVAKRRHARFLLRTGKPAQAEWELLEVLAAEPWWVDAMHDMAEAVDAQGPVRRAEAIAAWQRWLEHAPREPAEPRIAAEARLTALRAP